MKIGSLFSGIGGLDLAVQEAFPGARLSWVSEVEISSCKVLEERFPGVPNLGDIESVDWTLVEPVDIIAGGSPCQDLSSAGERRGMYEGTRSGLWFNMLKAIREIKPHYVVWENVRGALSARASSDVEWQEGLLDERPEGEKPPRENDHPLRALGRVLGDLHEAGYDAAWTTFRGGSKQDSDWDHVGAPHQRERVFVLATYAPDNR